MDTITGILQINVVEAKNLPAMDFNGKSDPYIECFHSAEKLFTSEIIKKSLNPVWNHKHNIIIKKSQENYSLSFKLWDWDKASKNDFIGEVEIEIKKLFECNILDKWYPITKQKKDDKVKERGELHIHSKIFTKEEVYSAFWSSIIKHFSHSDDSTLNMTDFIALISAINSHYTEPDIVQLFHKTDLNKDGSISVSELESLFNNTEVGDQLTKSLLSGDPNLIWEAYAQSASPYPTIADNIFDKGFTSCANHSTSTEPTKTIHVHNRETGKMEDEKIPHYIEVSLRAMYSTHTGRNACNNPQVKKLLKFLTNKTGKKYTVPESVKEIQPFIKFHHLNSEEILDPLDSFKNFNEFFYRKLKPTSRPIAEPNNPKIAVSPADCRLNVFSTIHHAQELWIKGKNFTVESLLGDKQLASQYTDGSLVIARLAPQDYHRFHIPVDGVIGSSKPIDGEYFTVNPIAIRENIDVYSENKRVVTKIDSKEFGQVLFVSVGATMVGSINLTTKEGQQIKKGDEHGYFAFGGSTILLLFKKNTIQFDNDLLVNSNKPIETLVKVGTSIGKSLL
ncbi:Phosphatidylserine decarboxylase proenzyme 2 precursor [Tieghemostelium lacteum]|uniref:Phosphatidylserine decarboxylase proenzyme 2 n=1 Tax=Tieghemostelium lacteum TaxID=361077 RepID=A0A152A534_TIELA|nr:Phosphatidylserine decarboxylase proenzyme 2 precursor [Tieghemostelium lacteum]|eukprot:KYR01334.1 Phosphatidylserine decarboxylase proenzyme 2 precursor [Tieghemostelium lacteum]